MAYTLTDKQTALAERFAKGDARLGDRAGGFVVLGSKEYPALEYQGQDAGKPISELIAQFVPNGTARYPLVNAAGLQFANSHMAWGRRSGGWNANEERAIQRKLRECGAIPIPFNMLQEAGIVPHEVHIVEKASAEEVVIKVSQQSRWDPATHQTIEQFKDETRHFVGACLFEAKAQCFLFDLDRQELRSKRFNPFVAQLPVPVTTIVAAYESLKPQVVREAEAKGQPVARQGEWFFIPTDLTPEVDFAAANAILAEVPRTVAAIEELEAVITLLDGQYRQESIRSRLLALSVRTGELKADRNRPNRVERYFQTADGTVIVSGTIEHTGREHEPITLRGWHVAVPNTATRSWTVTGKVD